MPNEKKSSVAVVMGSDSDMEVMKSCIEQLEEFGISPVVRIISAHRTPEVWYKSCCANNFCSSDARGGGRVCLKGD